MRRLKPSSEHPRALEASNSNEHEGNFESKDSRGRAARSACVPATAKVNAGGAPDARGIPRRSKVIEPTTTTTTMADEGDMGDESIAPSTAEGGVFRPAPMLIKGLAGAGKSGLMNLVDKYQKSVDEASVDECQKVDESTVDECQKVKQAFAAIKEAADAVKG